MSTLVTSNISDGSTSVGTSYVVNGSAKAWVNFNGTGTIAARDSLNVSSLTDDGVGLYDVNFTNSMSGTDTYHANANSFSGSDFSNTDCAPRDLTSGHVGVVSEISDGSNFDAAYVVASTHGDLA